MEYRSLLWSAREAGNLLVWMAGRESSIARREARDALDRVDLSDCAARLPRGLSFGTRRRLGLAQALLGAPGLFLFDEPTVGLDPRGAARTRELVRELAGSATVVISSHNVAEVHELCDHVAILDRARVLESGSMRKITTERSRVYSERSWRWG